FRVLLSGLPTDVLAHVSNAASAERKILVECVGDRERGLTDEQLIARMSPRDRRLVHLLEGFRCNPEAVRAATDLIKAVDRGRAGLDVAAALDQEGDRIGPRGEALRIQSEHDASTPCTDADGEWFGAIHELQAGARRPRSVRPVRLPGER